MTDDFDPHSRYGRKHAAKLQRAADHARRSVPEGERPTQDPDGPFVGWHFVRSRRWLGYFAIAVAFAIVCALFGMWQWDRRNEAVRQNEQVAQNYDHTPVPLDQALPTASSWQDEQEWLRVSVTGRYDIDAQLLVRNRVHNGQPGFEVLTPWSPTTAARSSSTAAGSPPATRRTPPTTCPLPRRARSRRSSGCSRASPGSPAVPTPHTDQVQSVTLADVAKKVDTPIWTGAYGELASESPAPTEARPLGWERPTADTGLHLSYFIQWFLFAAGGFGFLAYVMVQEYRNLNQDDPEERERAQERQRRKDAKPKTDAEIEDDLIASRR
ncbi:SURF1 family protein [Sphingomonas sp. LR61]|uniref:SURF1 family protein n=1 Tax=Sphingomonas sp. LR61 TaxID=3050234 RepID=UPI002FDF53C1